MKSFISKYIKQFKKIIFVWIQKLIFKEKITENLKISSGFAAEEAIL